MGIVRDVMGYPTVHGPDTQAHQNVIAFAVVGCYQPHQLERSYIPLIQGPIVESRDIKKSNSLLHSELIILQWRRVKTQSTINRCRQR